MPFLSFNPAFSLGISSYLNGEMPSLQGMVGVFVVTVGALVLSYIQSRGHVPAARSDRASRPGAHALSPRLDATMETGFGADRPRKYSGAGVRPDSDTMASPGYSGTKDHPKSSQPSTGDTRLAIGVMTAVGLLWASASCVEKRGLTSTHIEPIHFLLMQKVGLGAGPAPRWRRGCRGSHATRCGPGSSAWPRPSSPTWFT